MRQVKRRPGRTKGSSKLKELDRWEWYCAQYNFRANRGMRPERYAYGMVANKGRRVKEIGGAWKADRIMWRREK